MKKDRPLWPKSDWCIYPEIYLKNLPRGNPFVASSGLSCLDNNHGFKTKPSQTIQNRFFTMFDSTIIQIVLLWVFFLIVGIPKHHELKPVMNWNHRCHMVFRALGQRMVMANGELIDECLDKNNIVNDLKEDIVMISSKDDPECRGKICCIFFRIN